jgi:protein-tyrosine phosphatase
MGNICRSPMAERLLGMAIAERLAAGEGGGSARVGRGGAGAVEADPDRFVHSNSAGTGGWHEGEEMNPPAARQVRRRGGDPAGFAARKLRSDLVDSADLVLTATAEQLDFVVALRPDAAERTFVLGEFGRLLASVDATALPPGAPDPDAVYARGVALVAAAHEARGDAAPLLGDDLDDPWGRGDHTFGRVADEIDAAVRLLAEMLIPLP